MSSRLRHVYWIGGGSGAGKSVIARRVAACISLISLDLDPVCAGAISPTYLSLSSSATILRFAPHPAHD